MGCGVDLCEGQEDHVRQERLIGFTLRFIIFPIECKHLTHQASGPNPNALDGRRSASLPQMRRFKARKEVQRQAEMKERQVWLTKDDVAKTVLTQPTHMSARPDLLTGLIYSLTLEGRHLAHPDSILDTPRLRLDRGPEDGSHPPPTGADCHLHQRSSGSYGHGRWIRRHARRSRGWKPATDWR